eukprot:m.146842 g.146842  ORF g.146842 m.146842 type:complete len:306 (+) comp14153_c0_seq2:44-961(+)
MRSTTKAFVASAFVLIALACTFQSTHADGRVVYALNAGGPAVTVRGIEFESDLDDVTQAYPSGVSAESLIQIRNTPSEELPLYQTERYGLESFTYQIPTPQQDGEFVLVLKFAEVYFQAANQKVFDVIVNHRHVAAADVDIFGSAGFAIAYDIHVEFSIADGMITLDGESSSVEDTFPLEFAKGSADNPKICAFAVVAGTVDDALELLPLPSEPEPSPAQLQEKMQQEQRERAVKEAAAAAAASRESSDSQEPLPEIGQTKAKLRSQKRRSAKNNTESSLPVMEIGIAVGVLLLINIVYKMVASK